MLVQNYCLCIDSGITIGDITTGTIYYTDGDTCNRGDLFDEDDNPIPTGTMDVSNEEVLAAQITHCYNNNCSEKNHPYDMNCNKFRK